MAYCQTLHKFLSYILTQNLTQNTLKNGRFSTLLKKKPQKSCVIKKKATSLYFKDL